jgi:hypothetical protein
LVFWGRARGIFSFSYCYNSAKNAGLLEEKGKKRDDFKNFFGNFQPGKRTTDPTDEGGRGEGKNQRDGARAFIFPNSSFFLFRPGVLSVFSVWSVVFLFFGSPWVREGLEGREAATPQAGRNPRKARFAALGRKCAQPLLLTPPLLVQIPRNLYNGFMDTAGSMWAQFFEEGRGFHKTARGSVKRPQVFTPEIVQNIAGMGIEKYFMAIFSHRGLLPQNHTMGDLLAEAKTFLSLSREFEETLLYMDSLQNICSVFDFKITKPRAEDVPRFLAALDTAALLAERELAAG